LVVLSLHWSDAVGYETENTCIPQKRNQLYPDVLSSKGVQYDQGDLDNPGSPKKMTTKMERVVLPKMFGERCEKTFAVHSAYKI